MVKAEDTLRVHERPCPSVPTCGSGVLVDPAGAIPIAVTLC